VGVCACVPNNDEGVDTCDLMKSDTSSTRSCNVISGVCGDLP
jgi:hypothetical protein